MFAYTVYMHFIFKKVKLQKAGVEILNSRQNRIQYEKHYETKVNFWKLIKEYSTTNHESTHLTITSKYIKKSILRSAKRDNKSTITERHFNILLESDKSNRQK